MNQRYEQMINNTRICRYDNMNLIEKEQNRDNRDIEIEILKNN